MAKTTDAARSAAKSTYRITRPGAQHRTSIQEGGKKRWLTLGPGREDGDTLQLTQDQVASGGYDHLGVVQAIDTAPVHANLTSSRQPNKPEESQAAEIASGGKGADDTDTDGDDGDDAPAARLSKRKLNALIKQVEEAEGSSGVSEARKAVIEADIFEEGTVPTARAALIEALINYRDEPADDGE